MKRTLLAILVSSGLAPLPQPALAAGGVQRYALVAGANYGGPDRPTLQYAISDAERFTRVLVELGGVSPQDAILLKQPGLRELDEALGRLQARVVEAGRSGRAEPGGRATR